MISDLRNDMAKFWGFPISEWASQIVVFAKAEWLLSVLCAICGLNVMVYLSPKVLRLDKI